MLVLTRDVGELIAIGDDVWIKVLEVRGSVVRFGIQAPPEVSIHRAEVYRRLKQALLKKRREEAAQSLE